MPNSFSRFLSDEELQRVRELYLRSLDETSPDQTPLDQPTDGESEDDDGGGGEKQPSS